MSKPHSLAQNVVAKGILNIFNAVLPLIVTRYVFHELGPFNMGSIEYGMALMGYFAMVGLLGTYNYGLREISANRNNPLVVKEIFKNLLCINLVSNVLMLGAYIAFVALFITDPLLRTISWILCGNIISQVFYVEWYNEAMEEFRFITIKTMVIRIISVVFIFVLIHSPEDVYIYVAITSVVTIANYIVSYIYARHESGIPTRELFRGLDFRPYIVPLLTIMLLNNTVILYTMADRTILGYFTDAENVGYFALGSKVAEMTRTLLLSVVFATLPRLSLYLKEDKRLYQEGVLKLMRLVMMMIIPVGIGLFLLSAEVIDFFGGKDYIPAIPVMRLFSLRMIMLGVEAIMYNQIIFLHGKERQLVIFNLCCGLLNVALNFACLSFLSPLVSLGCTFASEIVFETLCYRFITRKLKVKLGLFNLYTLRYFAVSLLFIPAVWGIGMFNPGTKMMFIISIPLCMVIYLGAMYMVRDDAYMMLQGYVLKMFNRKKK